MFKHVFICLRLGLTIGFIWMSSGSVLRAQDNIYDLAVRQILNKNFSNYELIYSLKQSPDPGLLEKIEKANANSPKKLHIDFGEPAFFMVRRSPDGFFCKSAKSLEELISTNILIGSVYGADAKANWSALGNKITIDSSTTSEQAEVPNPGWTNRAEFAGNYVLSLGLFLQKGSVIWNGDTFSAETAADAPIPSDARKMRSITGQLFITGPATQRIEYRFPYRKDTNYSIIQIAFAETNTAADFPKQLKVKNHFAGGYEEEYSIEILKFSENSFLVDSPDVISLLKNDAKATVINILPDGKAKIKLQTSKGLKSFVVPYNSGKPIVKTASYLRASIFLALAAVTGVFLFLTFWLMRKRK